jgi:hypothetical protein
MCRRIKLIKIVTGLDIDTLHFVKKTKKIYLAEAIDFIYLLFAFK